MTTTDDLGSRALRIAMIATGRIADRSLAPAIAGSSEVELWSVFSRDLGRARDFAQRHRAAAPDPAFDDLAALLADPDLDAVLIASPDGLHAGQCLEAAKAGKHVLCEKPMATTSADAEKMNAACREAGVKLGIAYHLRWHRGHRILHHKVQAGEFGTLRHLRVQWPILADPSNWRARPEVGQWWGLAAVGTHCIDQIRWMMRPSCGEILRQGAQITRRVHRGPHDETALIHFEFESGATAELCTSVLFDAPRRMEIYGSDGYAICENTLGMQGTGSICTHEGDLPFSIVDPYAEEIEDFSASIREDRNPEVDGEEGLRNIELIERAIASGSP
ncbi:Gfo/Idh/MocA family protein [Thioalkalivibrio sp. HK1]|uniref:Gfo/Idh/MocA family protein n=1 Tax=Thioalkalivibrio sp. HK1 TaxID=1469245 RepID=UPI000470843D|nr:Gfo/Idh/MocA family oxidoreductase [Thioalkalivibrio sp. HK1]